MYEETRGISLIIQDSDDEEATEDTYTASRWVPVALKLVMTNSDEEARTV